MEGHHQCLTCCAPGSVVLCRGIGSDHPVSWEVWVAGSQFPPKEQALLSAPHRASPPSTSLGVEPWWAALVSALAVREGSLKLGGGLVECAAGV